MRTFTRVAIALPLTLLGLALPVRALEAPKTPPSVEIALIPITPVKPPPTLVSEPIVFRHGDISWLPALALEAGWPLETHARLGHIILRESGGCPYRQGGDSVDKNCVVTGVFSWGNRSDTGLTQINGLNYDMSRNKWALLCTELRICTQKPLFDPFINLVAAKVLYDAAGWDPWDFCTFGPKFAKQCKRQKWES